MAFKLSKIKPTFKADVEVFTANERCGHDKSVFIAEFKRVSMDEIDDLQQMKPVEVLQKKLVGWSEFLDDEGKEVPFNSETLESLLMIPEAVGAMAISFWQALSKQREKNSRR